MNEADTRANLIEPKLKVAGWTDRYVTHEYYYQRDHQYAPGRIILLGDQVRRGAERHPKKQLTLLRANFTLLQATLEHGSIVLIEPARIRIRPRPIGGEEAA